MTLSQINLKPVACAAGLFLGLAMSAGMAPAGEGDCAVGLPHALGFPCKAEHSPTTLNAVDGVPGKTAITIFSTLSIPALPFGHGELCVAPFAPGHGRGPVRLFDAAGAATFPLPPSGYFVQVWYRDADGDGNLSNMIQVPASL